MKITAAWRFLIRSTTLEGGVLAAKLKSRNYIPSATVRLIDPRVDRLVFKTMAGGSPKAQISGGKRICYQRVEDNAFHLGYFARCFRFPIARRRPKCARVKSMDAVCLPPLIFPKTKSWRSKVGTSLIEKLWAQKSRDCLVQWKFRSTRICSLRLSQTKSVSCRCLFKPLMQSESRHTRRDHVRRDA